MFSKKDWLMLGIGAVIGAVLIGLPIFFLSTFLMKTLVQKGPEGMLDLQKGGMDTYFSSELSMDSVKSSRGEPTKSFTKNQDAQLTQFLKSEHVDETYGFSDFSNLYTGKYGEAMKDDYAPVAFKDLPAIDNEVYVYISKTLCTADLIYFNAEKNAAHYYVGSVAQCSPSFDD